MERREVYARMRPACPTCEARHDVVGTCTVCRNLVYRDCEGDLCTWTMPTCSPAVMVTTRRGSGNCHRPHRRSGQPESARHRCPPSLLDRGKP